MLYGEINRQRLKIVREHVVADTIDYLEARFAFSEEWNELEKWAHFAKSGAVYDIRLTDDCIRKEDHLNLSAGLWRVYLHGNEFADGKVIERITTNQATLEVQPTGTLDGEPFPEIPASVTEQILARLENVEQNGGGSGGGSGGGITKETDPTVPDWAKQPDPPKYTASDVGAATEQQVSKLSAEKADKKNAVYILRAGETLDDVPEEYSVAMDPNEDGGEFPEGGGVQVDETLSKAGYAADAAVVGQIFAEQSEAIANLQISGLTTAQVNALDGMFKIASFTADPTAAYSAFKTAFGIGGEVEPDEPDTPTKTLTGISATYSGGDVTVGTVLTALTGIVVTATYSDGSTAEVTGYTLSGEIVEGDNTITVSYGGLTTTFVVTGVAESTGENNGWIEGEAYKIEWNDGYGIDHSGTQGGGAIGAEFTHSSRSVSNFLPCRGASAINVNSIYTNYGVFFYDSEQKYIANQRVVDYSAPVPVPPAAYYVRVQCITTNKANVSVAPVVIELMTESTVWESGKCYCLEWESGKQININAGGEVIDHPTNAKRDVSGFVLCMGAATIAIAFNLKVMVVFYDGDKSYISNGTTSVSANTVTVPDSAVYVRIDTCGYADGLNTWIMMQ